MQLMILANDAFMPDPSFDNPEDILNKGGLITETLWDIMDDKLNESDNASIVFVNSIILEIEVDDMPKGSDFELNLFIKPKIPIVSNTDRPCDMYYLYLFKCLLIHSKIKPSDIINKLSIPVFTTILV